jgi:hypothetical protein
MRAILVVVVVICALSASAMALSYEVSVQEMYRHGQYWPPSPIEFGAVKPFESVVFKACIAHHHSAYNGLMFTLLMNGNKTFEKYWDRWAVGECTGPEFEVKLGSFTHRYTLADNFTWGGYLGSYSWGFAYFEVRLKPLKFYGAIQRDAEAVDLTDSLGFEDVSDMTDAAPKGTNAFRVSSPSRDLFVYFDDETGETNNLTSDKGAHVMVCPDTNNNNICDRNEPDATDCWDKANGDWYRGYCCGTNYTEGFVKSVPINITIESVPQSFGTPARSITVVNNVSINAVCGKTSEGDWKWAPLDEVGEIVDLLGYPEASVVSDGTKLYSCGNQIESYSVPNDVYELCLKTERQRVCTPTFLGQSCSYQDVCVQKAYPWRSTLTINSPATNPFGDFLYVNAGSSRHMYSCNDGVVYECSGRTGPFSTNNGVEMGATNPSFTDEILYCASDGDWTTDLDIKDNESCNAAGFTWTGTYCCSEADDDAETYNDPAYPNAIAGCWKKNPVKSGEFAVDGRILNYKGQFFGCNITDSAYLALKDYHEPAEWVVNNSISFCGAVLMDARYGDFPHAVCQPNGLWKFTDELAGTIYKTIKWDSSIAPSGIKVGGCCAYDQCWNGARCVPLGSYYRVLDQGFVCKLAPESHQEIPPPPQQQ